MKKLLLLVTTCCLLLSGGLHAQADSIKPKLSDFVNDLQRSSDSSKYLSVVLWMPWQYWQTAFTREGAELNDVTSKMVSSFKEYLIFCVVDAQATPYGTFNYQSESLIRDSIRVIVNDSLVLRPVKENDLDQDMTYFISLIKPIMAGMMGQMGQNFNIYVFENRDAKGKHYLDAASAGKLHLYWRPGASFTWNLPLDVLTPPKYCPVDKQQLNGKFIYCPYHGNKLKPTK